MKVCFRALVFILIAMACTLKNFASDPLRLQPVPVFNFNSTESGVKKIKGNVYFTLGLLFPRQHYKDYVVSPNTYNSLGVLPSLAFGFEKRYPKYSGYLNLVAGYQKLNDEAGLHFGDPATQLLTLKFNTSRTWHLAEIIHREVQYSFGYAVNGEYTQRVNEKFGNASYTFDIWLNGGIANRFEFPFSIKTEKDLWFIHFNQPLQNFRLSWQLNVPLAGIITRPNYAGMTHFANGEFISNLTREFGDNLQFVTVNKFIMVQSQVEIVAPLGNYNQLRIAYQWHGFRYNNELNRLQGSWGAIQIGLLFKIDSRPALQNDPLKNE
jgi:hypothetical protein